MICGYLACSSHLSYNEKKTNHKQDADVSEANCYPIVNTVLFI